MKTLFIALFLSLTIAQIPACVTYNPATQTYVIDSYGKWEMGSEGYSQQYDRKKIKPKEQIIERPKIVKQPRPRDWSEPHDGD